MMSAIEEVPDLSIIMVTWNSLEITTAALASIHAQTRGITYEVIVIDNGTTKDATVEELPIRFPWIRFIANKENRGFTRANNQGIRIARGRYVLLINSDTIQTENAIGKAVNYMESQHDVAVLGIMHRNADEGQTFQLSFYDFPKPWQQILGLFGFHSCRSRHTKIIEQDVDWVCGSFFLIRRVALQEVGLLDERYFAYNEDIDWCFQAMKAGWKIRFWPGAKLIHIGSVAAPHLRDKTGMMFQSQLIYIQKNYGNSNAVTFYVAMGFLLILATVKQACHWTIGKASWDDIRQRWQRLTNFAYALAVK